MKIEGNPVPQPAVVAKNVVLEFDRPVSPAFLEDQLDAFLRSLTAHFQSKGCKLIAHIKGMLYNEANDHIFFSFTCLEQGITHKGRLSQGTKAGNLTLNVIVYGIDENTIENGIQEGLRKCFASDVDSEWKWRRNPK